MNLLLHPSVMTPLSKEISPSEYHRLTAYYPTERERRHSTKKYGIALSPYLMPALHLIDFAHNLARVLPRTKLIITLRNPVSRMYSHWKWEVLLAGTQMLGNMNFMSTFDSYVDKSLEVYPSMPMFTACGMEGIRASIYWQAVKVWMEIFCTSKVLVLDSDEYFRSKVEFMYKIYDFLGLPRVAPPKLSRNLNENPLKLSPPSKDSVDKLRNFFRPHNEKLWEIIGKSFEW